MKTIALLILMALPTICLANTKCTISKRNGGLVIEEQNSRIIVKRMFDADLDIALSELRDLITDGTCLQPNRIECDLTKRNGGFAVERSKTTGLMSNLKDSPTATLDDLLLLKNAGICSFKN